MCSASHRNLSHQLGSHTVKKTLLVLVCSLQSIASCNFPSLGVVLPSDLTLAKTENYITDLNTWFKIQVVLKHCSH